MVVKNWVAIAVSVLGLVAVPSLRAGGPNIYPDPYNFGCAMASMDRQEPLCQAIGDCCEPEPWLANSAELLWLSRTRAEPQPLMWADVSGTVSSVMDVRDLMFDVEAGIRVRSVLGTPCGQTLDVAYAGIYDQLAAARVTYDTTQLPGLNSMGYYFFGTNPTGVSSYTTWYESDLHSLECNWGPGECCRIRPLLGARWIRLEETFRIFESATPNNVASAKSNNDLVGGQLGFQIGLWDRGDWFRVEATAKSGVYYNYLGLNANSRTAGIVTGELERRFTPTSVAGEINVTAVAQLTPCIAVHFGYSGLWLANVGLAPDQSNNFNLSTNQGNLDLDGVSFQGGHFGLEVIY